MSIILTVITLSSFLAGLFIESMFGKMRRIKTLMRQDPLAGVIKSNENQSVNCPPDSLVIAFAGQSNNANFVPRLALQSLDDAYMYDYIYNRCTAYSEPIIGTDGYNKGHVATDVIRNLRLLGISRPIIVVGFARDGSAIVEWSDGAYYERTKLVANSLKKNHMKMDILLWHQGESDTFPNIGFINKHFKYGREDLRTPRKEWYERLLTKYLVAVKSEFPSIKIGVAVTSYCYGDDSLAIRNAQLAVAAKLDFVDTTINTDYLKGLKYRYDDCHFNSAAAEVIGKKYAEIVLKFLD